MDIRRVELVLGAPETVHTAAMKGVHQHCAEEHLHRYVAEFDPIQQPGDIGRG